jgi:hypothetical protein
MALDGPMVIEPNDVAVRSQYYHSVDDCGCRRDAFFKGLVFEHQHFGAFGRRVELTSTVSTEGAVRGP